jgi:DNA-binding XRE family transcriptional regulator
MKRGLTQKAISEILGMTNVSYSAKENNKKPFTLEEAYSISLLFEITVEALFFADAVHKLGILPNNSIPK